MGDSENSAQAADPVEKSSAPNEKEKVTKSGSKPANAKMGPSGFSDVSPSYSQLQSGLQDIVKSYAASKSSSANNNATSIPKDGKSSSESEKNDGKRKKGQDESESANESSNNFFTEYLDRTKSDYYCKVCDSHMNSEQMWENHVQGKRHLKNVKKEPGEQPSKVKSVRADITPEIQQTLDDVCDPVVGLDFMCELQRAESYLDPTYSCFLCHATCTVSTIVDHILGTKHRLAYLKAVNPNEGKIVEEMQLKKAGLTSIAEDYARDYEISRGRGRMEVKLEKPKMVPPPSKKERRYSDDDDYDYYHRRPSSPLSSDWRRDRSWSPPLRSSGSLAPLRSLYSSPDYSSMSMTEKLSVLRQVTNHLIVVSESEGKEIMQIINSLTQSLLQYKIRVLPPSLQDTLARHIISGDTQALESTLGLGSAAMTNVGSVINSMTASGDFPMRGVRRNLSPSPGVMSGPSGGMSGTSGGMSGPSGRMSGPSGRMSGPSGRMSGPSGRMSGPHGGMSGPHDGMSGPHDGMSGPHDGMSGPHDGMSGPHGGMSGPHGGLSDPHGGLSDPHGGLSGPHGGMSGPPGGMSGPPGGMSGPPGGMSGPPGGMDGPSGGMGGGPIGRMGPGHRSNNNFNFPENIGVWSPPGSRMPPSPMRGGYSASYPSSSQWRGGMGSSPFQNNDKSSLGY